VLRHAASRRVVWSEIQRTQCSAKVQRLGGAAAFAGAPELALEQRMRKAHHGVLIGV
jgi:hypothetical protein